MVIELIEGSAIWAEIIRVISKSNERAAQVRFEITSMISDQNYTTQGSITTLSHPFWNRPNTGPGHFKHFIDAVLSGTEIKFIHFWGGGGGGEVRVLETKVAKFATWYSVFHFSAIWSVTLNKPWNLIGCFVFSVASSLHWFMNKSHQLEPIRLQGPPVISKWT